MHAKEVRKDVGVDFSIVAITAERCVSVRIAAHGFVAPGRRESLENAGVEVVFDEPRAAIGHADENAPRMLAARYVHQAQSYI
jgi:hypothetical protein